jgi:hypothetical protein
MKDLLASGFLKRSKLQIKMLLKGRDTSVADLHRNMCKFAKILANGTPFARYFCENSLLGNWLSENLSQNLELLRSEIR